jgi:hypothetical protein
VTLRRSGSDIWMEDFIATSPTYAAAFSSMRMVANGSRITGGSFIGVTAIGTTAVTVNDARSDKNLLSNRLASRVVNPT